MSRALPVRRGCGSRKAGGVYLETGLVAGGSPIEAFLYDPPLLNVEKGWLLPHRTPILFEHGGIWHVVIWVGEEYYPSPWDYIEEVRVAGSSRRVPATFDFGKLGPGSRQYFVHAGASVQVLPEVSSAVWDPCFPPMDTHCPKGRLEGHVHVELHPPVDPNEPVCLGLAKYVRVAVPTGYTEGPIAHLNGSVVTSRVIPCGKAYPIYDRPPGVLLPLQPAVFMCLPVTGICMVTKGNGQVDATTEARVSQARVDTYRSDQ
jgi:hypothetical protein